jgi:hypothetical protein
MERHGIEWFWTLSRARTQHCALSEGAWTTCMAMACSFWLERTDGLDAVAPSRRCHV